MIILLDENFPLRFYTRLQKKGSQLNIFYSPTGEFTTEHLQALASDLLRLGVSELSAAVAAKTLQEICHEN